MSAEFLEVHTQNPHLRQVRQIVARLREGAIIAYPTDSCYAFGCHIGDKAAVDRIRAIRGFGRHHHFTLLCRDIAEVARYARVDNWHFRMLKQAAPGPYTFVLTANLLVPRRLHSGKRKTIGVRIPENAIAMALLEELGEPILSCTAQLPDDAEPFNEAEDIRDALDKQLDLIVDGGPCGFLPTTVVDLSGSSPQIIRQGKGPIEALGL